MQELATATRKTPTSSGRAAEVLIREEEKSVAVDKGEDSSRLQVVATFAREHVAIIGVICAVAAVFAGMQLFGARTTAVPLNPSVVSEVSVSSPQASPTPEPTILVHVLGAVNQPGVVALPVGARVRDAIAASGGLTDEANPGELNLAQLLFDGAQLVIGNNSSPRGEVNSESGSGGSSGTTGAATTRLNLNTATAAQLETLPGVGPVTAERIIAWREQHGRFTNAAELQEISGIGVKTYAQLEPYVTV
jgi:competence protein ComEA